MLSKIFEFLDDQRMKYGEGTEWDLDYDKLLIIGLLLYLSFFKDYGI